MNDTLILVPTYNNAGTLENVLQRCLEQGLPVLVVDDGSTDDTARLLKEMPGQAGHDGTDRPSLRVITHPVNQGKGRALKTGFQEALKLGYSYVITIDSDGQHFPEDIPTLLAQKGEKTLVVGSRSQMGADGGSSFANRFSNFWFRLYTGVNLPDTQTGFRLYPVKALPSLRILSARYEAELALLVFSAWKGLELKPVAVRVSYPEDRVSHFRPGADFFRISILNTVLLLISLVYGWPRTLLRRILGK